MPKISPSHGQGKPQNGQGNVREKSVNFLGLMAGQPWHWKLRVAITGSKRACHNDKVVIMTILDHYNDVIMSVIASQITGIAIVYSTVCSGTDQRKHQSSASLAFVRGIHRRPVNSLHKGPVTRKMFPFDNVIMSSVSCSHSVTIVILMISTVMAAELKA